MTIVMISLISEQAIPNVIAPLLAKPRPNVVKCILPTDPRDPRHPDSKFVSVYQGVHKALEELEFHRVYDRGPVHPYDFDQIKAACRKIRQEHAGATFIYNVTGGTKLMAQAALADAENARKEGQKAWAVYVDTENAHLVTLDADAVSSGPYDPRQLHGINVVRYFQAYGVVANGGVGDPPPDPWLVAARAAATRSGSALMKSLAEFSESKAKKHSTVEWNVAHLPQSEREALDKLVAATDSIGSQLRGDRLTWPITKESKDFIWRRHWLEWYTFDCLRQVVASQGSAWHPPLRNVKVTWPGWESSLVHHDNELDVTTVRNGRLLICECKAGKGSPAAEHIYKLQVVGYKAGTFADKVLVTATPHLLEPGRRQGEELVIRALTLDILLVGADELPRLQTYFADFDDWLYEQQSWFGLRTKE